MESLSLTEKAIKNYFESVLEKSRTGEKFPVSLDYVWPISYSEKGKAVRALTDEFIEGVDYEVNATNGKNLKGGRPANIYRLSVPCLEYFVARKVRSIFEVYRQVFHKVVEPVSFLVPQTFSQALMLAAQQAELIEQQQKQIEETKPKADFYDAVTGSTDTVDIGTVAKVLNFPKMGRNNLFELLRKEKVLMENNQPYQNYVDREWFRVIETKYTKPDGSQHVSTKTVVYQKGVDAIRKILIKNQ